MNPVTSQTSIPLARLSDAFERIRRPAVGFVSPDDVVKDPDLPTADKREILSSWASDACAVIDQPKLRWLLGTPEPVPLLDVLDALTRLERRSFPLGVD
jgi:hypothetical protein